MLIKNIDNDIYNYIQYIYVYIYTYTCTYIYIYIYISYIYNYACDITPLFDIDYKFWFQFSCWAKNKKNYFLFWSRFDLKIDCDFDSNIGLRILQIKCIFSPVYINRLACFWKSLHIQTLTVKQKRQFYIFWYMFFSFI